MGVPSVDIPLELLTEFVNEAGSLEDESQITVAFCTQYDTQNDDDVVKLSGNSSTFGQWEPSNAITATRYSGGWWSVLINVPRRPRFIDVEMKWVVCKGNELCWEDRKNRLFSDVGEQPTCHVMLWNRGVNSIGIDQLIKADDDNGSNTSLQNNDPVLTNGDYEKLVETKLGDLESEAPLPGDTSFHSKKSIRGPDYIPYADDASSDDEDDHHDYSGNEISCILLNKSASPEEIEAHYNPNTECRPDLTPLNTRKIRPKKKTIGRRFFGAVGCCSGKSKAITNGADVNDTYKPVDKSTVMDQTVYTDATPKKTNGLDKQNDSATTGVAVRHNGV